MTNKNPYLSRFLSLKCAGDVLNVVNPVGRPAKEITEAMAVIKHVKKIALVEPMKYHVLDLCAGNGLAGVISAFLLPVKSVLCVDKRPRKRRWEAVRNFSYQTLDIDEVDGIVGITSDMILVGVHACRELSEKIVDLYLDSDAGHLVLMPCCHGSHRLPRIVSDRMGKYLAWCLHLALRAGGQLYEDRNVLSPKNAVVVAHKE